MIKGARLLSWFITYMSKFEIAQIVTAIATAVVALLALCLAIYEGMQSRKHHRISLKPKLVLDTSKGNNPTNVEVKLVNSGLGPATIKSMKIFLSGQELDGNLEENLKKSIERHIAGLSTQQKSTSVMNPGYVLRASQESQIARVVLAPNEKCSPEELVEKLNVIDVVVEYESFYGEPDMYDSRIKGARLNF